RIASIATKFPALRTLALGSFLPVDLSDPDFPHLESFQLALAPSMGERVTALREASWPRLRTLIIDAHAPIDVAHLLPLFDGRRMRQLKRLHLRGLPRAEPEIDVLLASPTLARLEMLDLTGCALSDEGAETIIRHAPRFERLRQLVLPLAGLDPERATA